MRYYRRAGNGNLLRIFQNTWQSKMDQRSCVEANVAGGGNKDALNA
jgi:hypothetical protein